MHTRAEMIKAIRQEVMSRQNYLPSVEIDTLYLGGGTPSLLTHRELDEVLEAVYCIYPLAKNAEITLECNPEDVSPKIASQWLRLGINRISLGVQSLNDALLSAMGRLHNANKAKQATFTLAEVGFENLSIDLIFGINGLSNDAWRNTLEEVVRWPIQHISCYDLTIEGRNLWSHFSHRGRRFTASEEESAEQFRIAHHLLEANGFDHYEISNYGRPGFESRHNQLYWKGYPYMGAGPSAHSYDGQRRRHNIANNYGYIQAIFHGRPYFVEEVLTANDRFNEWLLTRLRVRSGLSRTELATFPKEYAAHLIYRIERWIETGHIQASDHGWHFSLEGMLLADCIISDLMV